MIKALSDIIFQVTQLDPETTSIDINTEFVKDLGMDSISLVTLVFMCEQVFEVRLSQHPEVLTNLTSVGSTLDFISYIRAQP